ncbi:MAG: glycosyltransferase family 4 protein [Acidobacteriota bacterium]|nr:MAG: glycosyltransferase family 4 protein [Acidobacteriota bacterium]
MKIAIYHGYELGGSGSNEYTRYLARALAKKAHDVVLICGESRPEKYEFISRSVALGRHGQPLERWSRETRLPASVTCYQLPRTSVLPVYLTDKQREGTVKMFPELTDSELAEYHDVTLSAVSSVIRIEKPDVLHCNHLVYQPVVAAAACSATATPYYVVPHGSAIEYTVKADGRFRALARRGLERAAGVIWIAREVRERILSLYPMLRPDLEAKGHSVGVGTDTSLFKPLKPGERSSAFRRLAAQHRRGGKTGEQRAELRRALDAGNVEATRRYWNAYDHRLEDDDLPALLERVPHDASLLLFVGALTYGKGVQSLIAALPSLLRRRPSTHLVIVGSGTYREVLEGLVHVLATGNESAFEALVSRGRDLERADMSGPMDDVAAYASDPANRREMWDNGPKLSRHVHFLGRLDHERLREIFPCCQIAVFPSIIKEASPLVLYEALANGVLPVGPYHSGLRDGLDELRTHLDAELWEKMKLPQEADLRVSGLVESLDALLGLVSERDLGHELHQIAVEQHDWSVVAARLGEAIEEMLSTRMGHKGSA